MSDNAKPALTYEERCKVETVLQEFARQLPNRDLVPNYSVNGVAYYKAIIDVVEKLHRAQPLADEKETRIAELLQQALPKQPMKRHARTLLDQIHLHLAPAEAEQVFAQEKTLQKHLTQATLADLPTAIAALERLRNADLNVPADWVKEYLPIAKRDGRLFLSNEVREQAQREMDPDKRQALLDSQPPFDLPIPEAELPQLAERMLRNHFSEALHNINPLRNHTLPVEVELHHGINALKALRENKPISLQQAEKLCHFLEPHAPFAHEMVFDDKLDAFEKPINIRMHDIIAPLAPLHAALAEHRHRMGMLVDELAKHNPGKSAEQLIEQSPEQFYFHPPAQLPGMVLDAMGKGAWVDSPGGKKTTSLEVQQAFYDQRELCISAVGALAELKHSAMPSLAIEDGRKWVDATLPKRVSEQVDILVKPNNVTAAPTLPITISEADYRLQIEPRQHPLLSILKANEAGKDDKAIAGFHDPQAREYIIPLTAQQASPVACHLQALGLRQEEHFSLCPTDKKDEVLIAIKEVPYRARVKPLIEAVERVADEHTSAHDGRNSRLRAALTAQAEEQKLFGLALEKALAAPPSPQTMPGAVPESPSHGLPLLAQARQR